jgi:hypothetical protein
VIGLGWLTIASVSPAHAETTGSLGVRLVDVPAAASSDPRALLYIVDRLAPAAVIHRRIEISNGTAAGSQVVLYAAAADIAKTTFSGEAGHTANDLSSWTSVSPDRLWVPAGQRMTASVTVAVPAGAAPGEQYAVVWAETRTAAPPGGGVTQVSRVGIRMYVEIGPGGAPAADFAIDSMTPQRSAQGRPVVLAAVRNTGGRALDLSGSLMLTGGPGGTSAGPFPTATGLTLAIGDTEPFPVVMDARLPSGPWKARLTLHSGLVVRSGSALMTFPSSGSSAAIATDDSAFGGHAKLIALAGALAVFVIATAVWFLHGRRQRPQPRHST